MPVIQSFIYHLGAADVWISNVSPHGENDHFQGEPGGVEFILHVDFESHPSNPKPIDVGITITVEDQVPFEIDN